MKSSMLITTMPSITTALPLTHKATMRIDDPAGLEISCTRGSIWLTLDNDLRDIILTAGTTASTFTTPKHSVAVLYALQDSQITVAATDLQVAYTQRAQVQSRCQGNALLPLVPA